jgi:adenosylcobinamide-GDP ribazoletransferase
VRRAVAFLTPLPVGSAEPTAATFDWFPLVGALIGLAVGGTWWAADHAFPPAVAAAVAVAADLALTGMLHVDGLADTADGVLPHFTSRGRRLAVMAAPDVGAFGIAVVGSVLLLRYAAFASQPVSVLLVAGLWCGSRTVMAVAARAVPYARDEAGLGGGLASAFAGGDWRPVGLYGLIAAVSLGAFADGRRTEVAVAAGIAAGALVVVFCRRRLGGYTGDVLGAAGVIAETVGLVVATAKW